MVYKLCTMCTKTQFHWHCGRNEAKLRNEIQNCIHNIFSICVGEIAKAFFVSIMANCTYLQKKQFKYWFKMCYIYANGIYFFSSSSHSNRSAAYFRLLLFFFYVIALDVGKLSISPYYGSKYKERKNNITFEKCFSIFFFFAWEFGVVFL